MMVGAQAESESAAVGGASAGAQAEWLHMQLGGSFERTAWFIVIGFLFNGEASVI